MNRAKIDASAQHFEDFLQFAGIHQRAKAISDFVRFCMLMAGALSASF